MASKLEAARLASAEGTAVLIAGGARAARARARAGRRGRRDADRRRPRRRPARIRHIAVGARHRGALVVNDGALRALAPKKRRCSRSAWSASRARSTRATSVEIRDGSGRVHGRGLVNYPAEACRKLAGRHSEDDRRRPRLARLRCVITRDNLVMGAV
jgi:glutamate 5-kinase